MKKEMIGQARFRKVTINLTEAEYDKLKELSGGSVSKYVRECLFTNKTKLNPSLNDSNKPRLTKL